MTNVIVAFSKIEDARKIKAVLVRHGFNVVAVCQSMSYVLSNADHMESGIVVCSYRLSDGLSSNLRENLNKNFKMLVIAAAQDPEFSDESGGVKFERKPINVASLVNSVNEIIDSSVRKKKRNTALDRNEEDKKKILKAKELLMTAKSMSEEDAHRYMQKQCMESGNTMVDMANMIIMLYG